MPCSCRVFTLHDAGEVTLADLLREVKALGSRVAVLEGKQTMRFRDATIVDVEHHLGPSNITVTIIIWTSLPQLSFLPGWYRTEERRSHPTIGVKKRKPGAHLVPLPT
jgi:hypothetical protein